MNIAELQPDYRAAFLEAMAEYGLITNEPIQDDGQLHRFHVDGDKPGSLNGWYCFYGDSLPAGSFGCWKRGINETWCSKSQSTMSEPEKAEYRHRMEQARHKRNCERQRMQEEAAHRCQELWDGANSNVQGDHP